MSAKREETVWLYKMKDLLSGDLAKLSSRMDAMEAKMSKLDVTTQRTFSRGSKAASSFGLANSKMFKGLSDEIPGLERMGALMSNPYLMAGAAVTALGVLTYKSYEKAEDYKNQFLEIENLNLDKTKTQLENLNKTLLNTSLAKGIDPMEMAKAVGDIQGGTGKFGNEVVRMAGRIGEFSMATKTNFDNMTGGVVKAMNAYKFNESEIDKFLTSNAKAVAVGIATFDDMAKVQTEFAQAATGAGQGYETANKFFGAFTKVSKNVDIAATLTKTAFTGLADPKVQKGLMDYGVNVFDASGKMKDATVIVEMLNGKISKMSDNKFSHFMGDVGGPEGMRELLNMIKGQGDALIDTFHEFDNTKFDIGRVLKNAKNDPKIMKQIVGNQISNLQVQFGSIFLEPVAKGLNFISEKLAKVTGTLGKLNMDGGKFLKMFESAKPIVTTLFDILTFSGQVMFKLYEGMAKFAMKSELAEDIAHRLGQVFKGIGWVIEKMFQGIGWWIEKTILWPLEKLEGFYNRVNGNTGTVERQAREDKLQNQAKMMLGQENFDKLSDPEIMKAMSKQFGFQNRGDVAKLLAQGKGADLKNALTSYGAGGMMTNSTTAAGSSLSGALDNDVKAITDGGKSVRNITVNIEKLVEKIENHISNGKDFERNSRDIITEALISIVRDTETTLGGAF